ncbi:hypothetical protein AYL99_02580 [Fonsecaea erecta]|uniref:AAA+ ATPase domain-containing protein n=1 Tax=Fonsecaea erecta TaxID=1367422 RepID=A0A178ZVS5_9EURO|nr:hypothetical protein AYL99_02580 [Fonsecaea erecta]OAP63353.1 hypothetical protein AYL99_02580 [Fonsecaea erecta]
MADMNKARIEPNGRPDLASAILSSLDPIFSIPIYLMTIFSPHYRRVFSGQPWTKRLLSTVLAAGISVLLFVRLLRQFWSRFCWDIILYWTTTEVHVNLSDDLYMALWWLSHKENLTRRTNEHHVASITSMINTSPEDRLHMDLASRGRNGSLILLPETVNQVFHYKGRSFFLHRVKDDVCIIRCLGGSLKPIEDLLDDAYEGWMAELARCSITLFTPKQDTGNWNASVSVSARSLESVEIGSQVKMALLADIDGYLNGKDWYRQRCIPWRRGYLFHGPPGTGKSSLVTALAAHFQLSVYAITFSDGLTDGILQQLLRRLNNTKCIVLLEDIDSAGLAREGQDLDKIEPSGKMEEHSRPPARPKGRKRGPVTLSGVLNAIDGIGAPEGHILILTSNYAERLEPALTRPGRVDYHLEFGLATKEQAHGIFLRLQAHSNRCEARSGLEDLAKAFADKIPEKVLSPAEIQDFLLHRRDDLQKAVDEVNAWVQEMVAAKGRRQEGCVEAAGENDDRESDDGEAHS